MCQTMVKIISELQMYFNVKIGKYILIEIGNYYNAEIMMVNKWFCLAILLEVNAGEL